MNNTNEVLQPTDLELQETETELQEKPTFYTDNTQAKCWFLTCNNYADHGYDYDNIQTILQSKFKTLVYYAMSKEVSRTTSTPHIHLYIACSSNIRFGMLQKHLPNWDIRKAKGTVEEAGAYLRKEGEKHKEKAHTYVFNSFFEWGDISKCAKYQGQRTDLTELYEQIKDGMSTFEILESNPNHLKDITHIERVRLEILSEKYKNVFRVLETTYIWGATNTNKTRSVLEKYGYENVYRVTNYVNPWDGYKGQDVVVLDEYLSQFPITDFNQIADGYPMMLRARYFDRVANFTKLYLLSNSDIISQYPTERVHNKELWAAFARRIHAVRRHYADGTIIEMPLAEYLSKSKNKSNHNSPRGIDDNMTNPPWHLVDYPVNSADIQKYNLCEQSESEDDEL